jgi:5-formyltetrahydrofolate cyclo-ligase
MGPQHIDHGKHPPIALQNRDAMRRAIRSRRRALAPATRAFAARSFARMAAAAHLLRPALRVAAYLAFDAEADAAQIIALAQRRGCELFLPAITNRRRFQMRFVRYTRDSRLQRNAFGILEPQHTGNEIIAPLQLDLIFMPLLAFDDNGARLGSGAGFYDRCLQHLHAGRQWRRPKLIGIGYEFQRVTQLIPHVWDIPLDGVITERCYRRLHPTRTGAADELLADEIGA